MTSDNVSCCSVLACVSTCSKVILEYLLAVVARSAVAPAPREGGDVADGLVGADGGQPETKRALFRRRI